MDTNVIRECFFCWDNVPTRKSYLTKTTMTKIYASCIRHLNESVMGNNISGLTLKELDNGQHKLSIMCVKCLKSVKTLTDINTRLEGIEKEINDFANVFTKATLTLRKVNGKSKQNGLVNEVDRGATNAVSEILNLTESDEIKNPNEFIHIKSETDQDYEPEDVTDYFNFDDENSKQIEPTQDPLSIDNESTNTSSGLLDPDEIINSVENQKSPTINDEDVSCLIDTVLDASTVDDDVEIITDQCNPEISVTSQTETCAINSSSYNHVPPIQMMQSNGPECCPENSRRLPCTDVGCSKNINKNTRNNVGMLNELRKGNRPGPTNVQCHSNMICKCNICGKILPSEQSMIIHLEVYHKVTVPYPRNDNMANNLENFNPNSFPIRPPVQNYVTCNVCFAAFPSAQLLYSHQKQCFPQRPGNNHYSASEMLLCCELCPSSFRSISDLRLHVCTVHDIPLHCEVCQMTFNDPNKLEIHKMSHKEAVICSICQAPFPNINHLNIHLERVHFLSPRLYNDVRNPNVSPNALGRVSNINTVTTVHNNAFMNSSRNKLFKPFRCLICDANFNSISDLTTHGSVHPDVTKYNVSYRICVCEICGACFTNIVDHQAHTKAHSNISNANIMHNSSLFRCSKCEKCFNTKIQFTTHQIEHEAQTKIYCYRCCVTFQSEDELMKHKMQNHPNDDFQPCKCTACGAFFKDIPHLEAHTRIDFQGPNTNVQIQFKCCICHEKFKTNIELSNHQNVQCRKRFHCSICNIQLANLVEMSHHNNTIHQGNGNEIKSCGPCPAPFPFENSLPPHQNYLHQIKVQQNRSPNTCNICKMPFNENTNIKCHYRLCSKLRHLRTNLKHFNHDVKRGNKDTKCKCPVCNKSFNYSSSLKFHLITHTKRKT